ncbi:MAG TPA: serpin family protein [Gemmatimonadales bacterium]|nr:serpin family protein [Gemmatimonadales bacterium]
MKLRLSAIGLLSFLACGDPTSPAPARITALPRPLTASEQRIVAADNRLAVKLVGQLTAETGDSLRNLFISPLSVAMALAMTYNGAAGTTEEAMRGTLELDGMSVAEVNAAYQGLIAMLRGLDPGVRFTIANSVWYDEQFTFHQDFLDATRTSYDARVEALDFTSPTAAPTINTWVSRATNGLIRDIVPDPIPAGMVMYLINAMYFKGSWTQQFDPGRTAARPFHLSDGSTVNVPTMTHGKSADVRVHEDANVQVVDLPYAGQAFSMTIAMPRDPAMIDALAAGLTLDQWNGWTAALDSSEREVFLPKFELENDLNLVPTLEALGMAVAFDDVQADFSRMHVRPPVLFISSVKHKTYVNVNEEGTEAAAATAVGMGVTCACQPPPILIDRPFIFALRENLSGTILFMGVIRNPAD